MAYRRKRKPRKKPEAKTETKVPEKKYDLVLVPTEDIPEVWPLAHDWIELGCVGTEFPAEHLYQTCLVGQGQLWLVWSGECEAAGVTLLQNTPSGLGCMIFSFGGSGMRGWWETQDKLWAWAKAQGCDFVRIYGRKGWARVLKSKGFETTRIILDKRL